MKKLLLIGLFFLMAFLEGNALTYYNKDGFNPSSLFSWGQNTDGTGTFPINFSTSGDIFTIRNGTTMVSTSQWNTGGGVTVSIIGTGAIDDGGFNNTITLQMASGSTYIVQGSMLNLSFGIINSNSILYFASSINNLRIDLIYPSLYLEPPAIGITGVTMPGGITTTGNITFALPSNRRVNLGNSTSETFTIGGNFIIQSGIVRINQGSNLTTLNITGDINIAGGILEGTNSDGNATITCANFNLTAGTFKGTIGGNTGVPSFTLTGNLNIAGGSYNAQSGSSAIPIFNLNGIGKNIFSPTLADANHTINLSGSYTLNNDFTVGGNLILTNGYILNLGTRKATLNGSLSIVGTGGTFNGGTGTVEFGPSNTDAVLPAVSLGTLRFNRASQNISMLGNVTVDNLDLSNGTLTIVSNTLKVKQITPGSGGLIGGVSSDLEFITGSTSGLSIPSTTYRKLTLTNSNNAIFSIATGGVTIVDSLKLMQSALNITNGLTLANNSTVRREFLGSSSGSLTGSPTFGASVNLLYTGNTAMIASFEIPSSSTVLNNFTNNNSSGITVNSSMTVNGNLTNTSALAINQPTTVKGVLTLTSAAITSGSVGPANIGNLTVDLNSGYISSSGAGSIIGNINSTKTITRSGYTTVAFPVQGSPSFPSSSYFFYYDELTHDRSSAGDAGWKAIDPSAIGLIDPSNITRGYSGYYANGFTALNVTGSYSHSSNYSLNVSKTAAPGDLDTQNGWNLLGNPFPSVLDWDGVRADNSSVVDAQCQYYNGTSYTAYVGGVPANMNQIPPMQSVFIKKTLMGPGSININKARRLNLTKNFTRRAKLDNVLEVAIDNGTINDKTYLRLHPNATDNFDSDYDANKLSNTSSILPNISTMINGYRFAINSFNEDSIKGKMIPLKITVPATGSFDLKFREEAEIDNSVSIFLHDKLRNVVQDIRLNPLYNITAVKGDTAARFFISFDGNVTGVENESSNSTISAHYDNGIVNTYFKNINANVAEVSFYNTMGMEIYNKKNANITNGKHIFTPNVTQAGVYILKVSTEDKTYTQRILINY